MQWKKQVFHLIGQFIGMPIRNKNISHSIHCRQCWNDTWEACEEWLNKYTNSVVGLTPLVTYSNVNDLLHVVKKLPMDKLVLETDAPYFIPRGGPDSLLGHLNRKFSLPPHVANVAAKVAMVKQCEVKDVLTASRENIRRIYKV